MLLWSVKVGQVHAAEVGSAVSIRFVPIARHVRLKQCAGYYWRIPHSSQQALPTSSPVPNGRCAERLIFNLRASLVWTNIPRGSYTVKLCSVPMPLVRMFLDLISEPDQKIDTATSCPTL